MMQSPLLFVLRRICLGGILTALCTAANPNPLAAQQPESARTKASKEKKPKSTDASDVDAAATPPKTPKLPRLYTSEEPLLVTFTTNLRQLRRDKSATSTWHPASISYSDTTGQVVMVPMRARTRGIWRLKNCQFPPVRIKVGNKAGKNTWFHDVEEPKMVNYCKDSDLYEQYVLQEFMLYRIYRLLTPVSHHARLLRIAYTDSASGKIDATRYGFIVEDPAQVAARVGGTVVTQKGAGPDDLDPAQSAIAFMFQYMIGNTDFSFGGLHNAELIRTRAGDILPIAYDFDYAGAVNTQYALPDPSLRIKSVRDRQFRGYCAFQDEYAKVLDLFKAKKESIYALYSDPIGQLLPDRVVKSTLSYFDDFYKKIPTPAEARRQVYGECVSTN